MRSVAVIALFAGVAIALPSYQPEPEHEEPVYEPAPVYETDTHTVTSYGPESPYYPATTTESEVHPTPYEPEHPETYEPEHPETYEPEPEYTTSVVYTTTYHTVTSCEPSKPSCPAESVHVETKTVPLYTTVCPVTETHKPTETHKVTETHKPVETTSLPVCPYCPNTTKTVVIPKPTGTETHQPEQPHTETETLQPVYPSETHVAPETHAPYPTGTETHKPVYPTGTAAPTSTVDVLPEFTGAANSLNAGMAIAGLGAFAALFI